MIDKNNWTEFFIYTISLKHFKYSTITDEILPLADKLFGKSLFNDGPNNPNENALYEYWRGLFNYIYFKNKEDALKFKLIVSTIGGRLDEAT